MVRIQHAICNVVEVFWQFQVKKVNREKILPSESGYFNSFVPSQACKTYSLFLKLRLLGWSISADDKRHLTWRKFCNYRIASHSNWLPLCISKLCLLRDYPLIHVNLAIATAPCSVWNRQCNYIIHEPKVETWCITTPRVLGLPNLSAWRALRSKPHWKLISPVQARKKQFQWKESTFDWVFTEWKKYTSNTTILSRVVYRSLHTNTQLFAFR